MRILVLGAGATGGHFGARLAEAGADVTFLVRPRRAELLRANGLRVKSQFGDCHINPVKCVEQADHDYDLILLSCKAYDLDSALDAIAPAVGNNTAVVPLLNGMSHVDRLSERFGKERVVGGFCIISATLDENGTILHLNDSHTMKYGELSGEMSDRIKAIDAIMSPANFTKQASEHIVSDMWEKWVMISSLAAVTTLMRNTVGAVASAPYGERIASGLFDECLAIATAHGCTPRESFVKSAGTRLVDKQSKLTASMLRDMQSGQQVESDQIIGDLIETAKQKNVPTPLLEVAYCNLKAYELTRA